jgi:hypothetical protein
MLFRPKFCTNCATRIERETWLPWTSRRFCETCEIEFKGREWLLRFAVGFTLLIGLGGFGTAWFGGNRPPDDRVTLRRETADGMPRRQTESEGTQAANRVPATALAAIPPARTDVREPQPGPVRQVPQTAPQLTQTPVIAESVYHCGAETRKGTPCSRRVKDPNTRCYQHAGMPTMLALESKTATKRR